MEPPKVPIEVKVASGKVNCNPDPCHAPIGHAIELICDDAFAIQFLDDTPFTGHSFRSKILNGKQSIKQTVKSSAVRHIPHSYACAVYSGGEVYLEATCPAIIID